MHQRRTKKKN